MSCLDVMYHQGYGTHRYLPETSAAAAAAAYYHYQQQQQRICLQGKMEDSAEAPAQPAQVKPPKPRAGEREESPEEQKGGEGDGAAEKEAQPAEAEYLSSRCVLFTYFQGDIGDVVDEHFSRALSQASALPGHAHSGRTPSGGLRRAGGILSSGQCADFPSSLWSSGYPSQSGPCLSSIHPDLSPSTIFHSVEHGAWVGHGLPTPPPPSDCWPYSLGAQGSGSYTHIHEDYPRVHPRHAPHVVHHTFGSALDPRLPGTCPPCSPATHGGISKTEAGTSSGPPHSWHISHQAPMDNTYELSE
ncbi:transcription cofactor vestigial-like protein 3 isoform X1 [Anguilla rostrata]|uniref:transcription cofactor vestigial-like protein 3 isoform X1 n=1 Tax=Anguilla rostrata TaxID=7938 RepID=UPI0030D48B43